MLEHAKKLAQEGKSVYVVFPTMSLVRYFRSINGEMVELGVKFEHAMNLKNFDWGFMRFYGSHPNCEVLVDHSVIERQFSKVLEMLHRYD